MITDESEHHLMRTLAEGESVVNRAERDTARAMRYPGCISR